MFDNGKTKDVSLPLPMNISKGLVLDTLKFETPTPNWFISTFIVEILGVEIWRYWFWGRALLLDAAVIGGI